MPNDIAARAALVRHAGAPFSVEDVRIEQPRANEILVRLVGSGVCHTDLVFRDGEGFSVPSPCVLGHEGSGVVEAIGSEVSKLVPGDHVVLTFHTCGTCPTCSHGHSAYCDNMGPYNYAGGRVSDGSSPISQNGARISGAFFNQSSFATYAIASENNAIKVPRDVPLEILGPLGCGLQTGAGAAILSMKLKPGNSLAIFGGGAVGLSALLGALAVGAGPVIVVEPKPNRRVLALELGAAHVVDPATEADVVATVRRLGDGGVTHALDTTGIPAVVSTAGDVLLNKGTLGIAGMAPLTAMLPLSIISIMARGLSVVGIVEGDSEPQTFIPHLIDLYRQGRFPFDRLITKFPFEQINDAVAASLSGEAIKPVLVFD